MEIEIGGILVGDNHPPFIVAEMSGNHNHSLERALEIVDAAAEAGAHALKIQTYTPDTITLDLTDGDFFVRDEKNLWKGRTLYDLYQEAHTPWEWHKPIFDRCREKGLLYFSSPFDASAVDFLETLNVPAYKIASFELIDIPLIKKAAATGKPIIISTGMGSEPEIAEAVEAVKSQGNNQIILLKCTSSYPAEPKNANIKTIPYMREKFQVMAGLSDHSPGIGVAVASVSLGSVLIEKHFTLSRSDGGVDSSFSMEPQEFKALVDESKRAWQGLGRETFELTEKEIGSRTYRRSLYVSSDIKAGEVFGSSNVKSVRPGYGLSPKYFDFVLGKKAKHALKKGDRLTLECIDTKEPLR
jgi:pseudaminic acid synthase